MKKTLLFLLLIVGIESEALAQAKKYIFLEHFTNTRCGICASRNPSFYNLLFSPKYNNQYHHMTVHPSFPYNNCQLYLANTTENTIRTNFYSIGGTPTLVIHGKTIKPLSSVNAATLDAELDKFSPVEVKVTESGSTQRSISIEVKTVGPKPAGNYKIYVAAVEKVLNYISPNGEKVHHNVFRKFLSSASGDNIVLANEGNSLLTNYTMNVVAPWLENQMYALVWIQESSTKEVLNSGNKFDQLTANTDIIAPTFKLHPNPVKDKINIQFEKPSNGFISLSISSLVGKELYTQMVSSGTTEVSIPVNYLEKGIYFVRIQSGTKSYSKKLIKE
ncbi:MAG: T9SS type A sorting domain-containing protein [Bacteroidota bacterium]|nr:T9SS type A sorting domain-containing protein [Bacteroidota bacterium]